MLLLFGAGDILTVQGNRETNKVNCTNCRSELTFINDERSLLLSGEPPPAKGKPAAKKPAKQAACFGLVLAVCACTVAVNRVGSAFDQQH